MEPDPLDHVRDLLMTFRVEPSAIRTAIAETRKRYGGEQVYLRRIDREARDQVIQTALQSGTSPEGAAKVAGCSPATVRRRRSSWL